LISMTLQNDPLAVAHTFFDLEDGLLLLMGRLDSFAFLASGGSSRGKVEKGRTRVDQRLRQTKWNGRGE
jgi:hypothetical protein